jgi:hypothetical protein
MHRSVSVHVEDPTRSLNRWHVWLTTVTRHHRGWAVAACRIAGDGCDGSAGILGEVRVRRSGGAGRESHLRVRNESALKTRGESALESSHESALEAHHLARHESTNFMP